MATKEQKEKYLYELTEYLSDSVLRIEKVIWALYGIKAELFSTETQRFVPIPDSFKRAFDQVIRDNKIAKRRVQVFLQEIETKDAVSVCDTEFDLLKVRSLEISHLSRLGHENASELQPMITQIRESYRAAASGGLGLECDWVDKPLDDDESEGDQWHQT